MPTIVYQGATYSCREGETVLDALLRQGVQIAFSCRSGVCHICMHRVLEGEVPTEAQNGIAADLQADGHFLPCKCQPTTDMEIAPARDVKRAARTARTAHQAKPLSPDPEMWEALGNGELLNRILNDFYTRVYVDERLASFFHGVTKQRAVEKQFLFLRQWFTGEKVYFGDRPRNAHHWMVISDELFDYRESLMAACLRRAGLPEPLVARWLAYEETFRDHMVKSEPWNRVMNGVELPVDGFGQEVLDIGSVCDGCGEEIAAGTEVRYHLRLGTTYCPACGHEG